MPISLQHLLQVQELDMKMIRLLRVRQERRKELQQIHALHAELEEKMEQKKQEIAAIGQHIASEEEGIGELVYKLKKLEEQQSSIRKVEEFTALTQEMTAVEREKIGRQKKLPDLAAKQTQEEEVYKEIATSLHASQDSCKPLIDELHASIASINAEGAKLQQQRQSLSSTVDPEMLSIYERLLYHKKDRVVVPLVNRNCMGCHIRLTAQHENLVRKAHALTFCEHCSRIHYWNSEEGTPERESR